MRSRYAVFGTLIALTMAAAPVAAQDAQEEDSEDLSAAMMCGSVYRVVAKQSKGMAAAEAYDASHTAISELATLLGTTVEDEAVRTRMKYSDEVVGEMLAGGESLGEMVEECNAAFGLSIAAD